MITVTVLSDQRTPFLPGVPFQLLSDKGQVVSMGQTDSSGVVAFDVDPSTIGKVAIRLDVEAWKKMKA